MRELKHVFKASDKLTERFAEFDSIFENVADLLGDDFKLTAGLITLAPEIPEEEEATTTTRRAALSSSSRRQKTAEEEDRRKNPEERRERRKRGLPATEWRPERVSS